MVRVSKDALDESKAVAERALNIQPNLWCQSDNNIRLITLNVPSIRKHLVDIKADTALFGQCDLLCLNETWLPEGMSEISPEIQIDGYNLHLCGRGRGRGVAIYTRHGRAVQEVENVDLEFCQMLSISLPNLNVIAVYISPKIKILDSIVTHLLRLIDKLSQPVVICGDFNFDLQKERPNALAITLHQHGFEQYTPHATHISGHLLDHIYANIVPISTHIHPVHFSDHDVIATILPCEHHTTE
jgi:exonuclease III